jgi:hypothetical protein
MPARGGHETTLQVLHTQLNPIKRFSCPEPYISGHLIIAAAPGVQLAANVAKLVDERRLDVHVHIFALEKEWKLTRFDLSLNFRQTSHNLLAFFTSDQSNPLEHPGVGRRTLNIVLEETMVKGDGLREPFHAEIGFSPETTTPRLCGHQQPSQDDHKVMRKDLARLFKFRHTPGGMSMPDLTPDKGSLPDTER